jgi:hypothetical protein
MTGIKFDAAWVGGYARLTGKSADALAEGVDTVNAEPLDQESFGELGRTVHITQAYAGAAQLLRDQFARAVSSLGSASDGLANVTASYQDSDDAGARTIEREEQP